MLRALIGSFFFSFTLLLAACGGESSSVSSTGSGVGPGPSTPSSSLSSVAVKGVLKGAAIQVLRWQSDAYVPVESVTTRDDGSFTLTLPDRQPGDVYKLRLAHNAGDTPIKMVCDAERCGRAYFGDDIDFSADLELTSWVTVGSDGAVTIMPITPVSTILVNYAEFLGSGHLSIGNLTVARRHVAALFRMSPADLLATPGNIASTSMMAAMTEAGRKVSLLSAAFAELAGGDAAQMGANIQRYSQAFIDNNGRLMEAGGGTAENLHDLYTAAYSAAELVTNFAVQKLAREWVEGVIDVLRNGELSATCHSPAGCELDSERFVDALGAMGDDVRAVIGKHGYARLENAIAGELNKFGWLISADTFALVGVAVQTVGYSISAVVNNVVADMANGMGGGAVLGSGALFPLEPVNGLTPSLSGNTLTVQGEQNGLAVDLTVTLPAAWGAMKGDKKFPIHVSGSVGNQRVSGEVEAGVLINAAGTDFTAFTTSLEALANNMGQLILKQLEMARTEDVAKKATLQEDIDALGLQTPSLTKNAFSAGADLVKTASFKVDVGFDKARLVKLDDGSQLSMEGQGYVNVDMKGGENGRIALNGAVTGGRITVPNGSWFGVEPGESLTFSMDKDGRFDADVSVSILTLFKAKGYGKLTNMGVMVSDLRDDIVGLLKGTLGTADQGEAADLGSLLTRLLTNIGSLDLLVEGDVTMVEPGQSYTGHVYKARLANTVLTVSQPNQPITNKALELALSWDGLLVTAGNNWWHVGLDLSSLMKPAVLLVDDTGNSWRYDMDFSELFATL